MKWEIIFIVTPINDAYDIKISMYLNTVVATLKFLVTHCILTMLCLSSKMNKQLSPLIICECKQSRHWPTFSSGSEVEVLTIELNFQVVKQAAEHRVCKSIVPLGI